jgi:hypothetical protein
MPDPYAVCLFCGEPRIPGHACDGRQGALEASIVEPVWFDGATYDPVFDQARLTGQLGRVWALMTDQRWRTLNEIADLTGDPPASVSARLRDLRKDRFGAYTIERQSRGDRAAGFFEYRLVPRVEAQAG